ncbi:diaminopimelate epimerase [Lichenifustis flavocetrariae]|uniref:Diaminopimelate epimerase n=1 Tax=Lichenifustis flavocetrariae TaxID=2949735 RepID=A0AA42CJ17_9HYPH|nr:diaminopimelate epimerase [Lichenifustis flavocetrariae]MCW6507501.1 diaminopimelate epimerase [Lichenifustis flavocetrariae]
MKAPDLPYFKMNGIGNSILVVDMRSAGRPLTPAAARAIAGEVGLGFDQLMTISAPLSGGTDAFVDIFNADGSRAEACGNGTRCVAWVLMRGSPSHHLVVETAGGTLICDRLGPTRFSVDMGPPRLAWSDIPLAEPEADTAHVQLRHLSGLPDDFQTFSAVNMGNPHAVFFVQDAATVPLAEVGPLIEHHPMFPKRANVSFAEITSRASIRLRVWERSAGATLACGSAACATLVAAARDGLTERRATVSLPGGDLMIEWRPADGHVVMAGDTQIEHEGLLPAVLWDIAA